MSERALYLDYAATTPVDERVVQAMLSCLGRDGDFGNPASSHAHGRSAREAVELARRQVGELVGARAEQLVWTSGATESNNLAIKGLADSAPPGRKHIITSCLEHKAVLDTAQFLEQRGFEVTRLTPDAHGLIQPDAVRQALREDTLLVSLMWVNNELGTLTDIPAIAELLRGRDVLLHVDAAQAAGKVRIDLASLGVDLMSFSAHKLYGPKGIGALYVSDRARPALRAQMHGGGHEGGLRSGTLPGHQIVGMGAAFALATVEMESENLRIEQLANSLRDGLLALPDVKLNGSTGQRIAHTLNLCIDHPGFNPASLDGQLSLSSTSACNAGSQAASHVLLSLGLSERQARSSLRISLGRYTRMEDVERAVRVISEALKAPTPFW